MTLPEMNVKISIIETKGTDYDASVQLRYKVLRAPLGLHYTHEQLEAEKNQEHVVAKINNEIVGVALLQDAGNAVLKVRQVAVSPDFQQRGIGSELMAFAEEYALENHFNSIMLHARKTAVPFYEVLDYETEGDEFTEIGIPHYKMWKRFDD